MAIFSSDKETAIVQLSEVAKINKSTPWNIFQIFLNDAKTAFLTPYLGASLLAKLESIDESSTAAEDKPYTALIPMVRRTLGPYAVGLATDEMSIATGDSGHTVVKSVTATPASDAKIAKAKESLFSRAWANMEVLLSYLEANSESITEWKDTRYQKNRKTTYFASAEEFQDNGLVDIGYSRLTFEKLRSLIIRIENSEVANLLGSVAGIILATTEDATQLAKNNKMLVLVRAFIGTRVAELHTSKNTRVQRSKNAELEYNAVIHPLYADESEDTVNYFTQQAAYWYGKILESLSEDFSVDESGKVDWNDKDKHVFFAG